jgi:hypothetical protein
VQEPIPDISVFAPWRSVFNAFGLLSIKPAELRWLALVHGINECHQLAFLPAKNRQSESFQFRLRDSLTLRKLALAGAITEQLRSSNIIIIINAAER